MGEMVRAAGIDCGTNTIRLLIADVDRAAGRLTDVARIMEVTRLGQGVDRTGWFAPDALERTLNVVTRYAKLIADAGAQGTVRFVATSATRDAANRNVFLDGVRAALGIEAEVIDGLEEAHLSFGGALASLRGPFAPPGPYLCVDLGGGSTELVLGDRTPEQAYSMDVGSVRITERHLRSDPPTEAEVRAAAADVDAALDVAARHVDLGRTGSLIGLAGSITTIEAYALGLERYDPAAIDGAVIGIDEALAACQGMWQASRTERSRMGFMHPGRVDVIGAGALVWSRVLLRVRDEVRAAGGELTHATISEHDILDGVTLSAAQAL
ncbi:MAG: Ppx/GppA family phosphatase [Bifidobacteriaceae bacterium]|jgi:exopolyphosphatase/guanosine-5'-triphosphate,3'-diphosphate pyrophosphatase|nr:Ppx/GppA family phosphatase [Bifidobacteriaceae bacterium]